METQKRTQNTQGLKVKFLPATNNKGSRIKLTQTNNNKSKIFSQPGNLSPFEFIINFLENHELVTAYNLVVNNTQNDYYLFSIAPNENIFVDLF
jgi:hypothetical protein